MSDLFHQGVSDDFIRQVFDIMNRADWHTYQILTKRSDRLMRLGPRLPWAPHIWIGVSVESREYLWRVEQLRRVPAVIRFLSAEPLIADLGELNLEGIHWVITGGESGAKHRPCDPLWVRNIRDQCISRNVAFFHKQWGGRTPKAGGRILDGRTWDQYPMP